MWLSFFLVQTPLIVLERLALGALKRRGVLVPAWLRAAWVVPTEVLAAQYLFFGPCKAAGLTDSILGNVRRTLVEGARWLRAGA